MKLFAASLSAALLRLTMLAPAIVLSLTAACLPFPHTHLQQPGTGFTVRDDAGAPVSGARIRIYSGIGVGSSVQLQDSTTTDTLGEARVGSRREWHLFYMLLPDGEAPWRSVWCADAPGFRATTGALGRKLPPSSPVRLSRDSIGSECPAAPRSLLDISRDIPGASLSR